MVKNLFHFVLLLSFLSGFLNLVVADPPYFSCPKNAESYENATTFQYNLQTLLTFLSTNASVSKIYNTSIGNSPDRVYGQLMCLNYISYEKCGACITLAINDVQSCSTTQAIVWEETCQLRYSNDNFLGKLDLTQNINNLDNKVDVSDPERFFPVVNKTMQKLISQAAFNSTANMYATGDASVENGDVLYALVQCTTYLSPDDCKTCLEIALMNVSSCCSASRGARLLSASCYLRYELYAFYDGITETHHTAGKGSWQKTWIITSVAIVLTMLVLGFLSCGVYCRSMRRRAEIRNEEMQRQIQLQEISIANNTNFQQHDEETEQLKAQDFYIPLATIRTATDNFSDSNRLGEGGFGPVYKGVLSDGNEIAAKRLSSCSEQGAQEFTNEVLLILKLQHKNLVRLLGFSVDGDEKLLVYEFLPNNSLDIILSDRTRRAQLDWGRRLNIINGIAKGILYLHEDSRLRIIHRDLKPSNVLLDYDMNPKISDFGMAKIFAGNLGEANTSRIVGTYGYMAPEYAMEGLYSTKSDIYSFGVLILEIITGKKNTGGVHQTKRSRSPSFLEYAWQLWKKGNALKLMDSLLTTTNDSSWNADEYLRCFRVGLLCVQHDPFHRPTMSSVVLMLKSDNLSILSQPQSPPGFSDHDEEVVNDFSVNNLTVSRILPR